MEDLTRFIARSDPTEPVRVKAFHTFKNCSLLEDSKIEELNEREANLLGLKECRVCQRRRTGGPALEALADILANNDPEVMGFDDDPKGHAWYILNALKEQGFYVAQRKVASA